MRDGAAAIERSSAPIRQHPLELYAMGLLDAAGVPELTLFEDQAQFDATSTSLPSPGTTVGGGRRTVSVNDIMAAHGPRQGPVLTELSRAAIVVSRERLLPPEDLSFWNFHAARHEVAARTGMVDYDGQGSFALSTDRRIALSTGIRPRALDPLAATQNAEPARFGPLDCRGLEFSSAPPTRVRGGQRFTVAGQVTARDRSDFSQLLIRFWPSDDVSDKVERVFTAVGRSGQFSVDVELRAGREGQYTVEAFLFWPEAPSQHPRCRLSTLNVGS
jgi:hypothetical protein